MCAAAECGLITAGVAAAVSTTLTEEVVNNLLEMPWKGDTGKIEKRFESRAVLGSSLLMERTDYAASPILKHLKKRITRGAVNVAYVPPAMGKTTACHALMNEYVKDGINRGLCFSPNDTPCPYLDHMIVLLGYKDTEKPPTGLLRGLLTALTPQPRTGLPSYLILDDFMPHGPTTFDIELLLSIKTQIRSMNIVVVALTANKASADYMLTMNAFETIIPLVELTALKTLRQAFKDGKFQKSDTSYHLDWEMHVSMEWDFGELKKAVLVDPKYEGITAQEKAALEVKIDTFLQQLTPMQRKEVSPIHVLQEVDSDSFQPVQTSQSGTFTHQNTGVSCGGCHVM